MGKYYRSFCRNFSAAVAPLTDLRSVRRVKGQRSDLFSHPRASVERLFFHSRKFNVYEFSVSVVENQTIALICSEVGIS